VAVLRQVEVVKFIFEDALGFLSIVSYNDGGSTDGVVSLEVGAGVYLQDYPLKVQNTTVEVNESSNRVTGLLQNIASSVGITDVTNKVTGFFKVATQFLVSVESTINKILTDVNIYQLEDASGRFQLEENTDLYELDQKQITENVSSKSLKTMVRSVLARSSSGRLTEISIGKSCCSLICAIRPANKNNIVIRSMPTIFQKSQSL